MQSDTYQFDDYSKYETSGIDVQRKAKRNNEIFPVDCQKAFDMELDLCKSNIKKVMLLRQHDFFVI